MTWWLDLTPAQMREARTCTQCGSDDADIDLGLCFDCFSARDAAQQREALAAGLSKYGEHGQEMLARYDAAVEGRDKTESG